MTWNRTAFLIDPFTGRVRFETAVGSMHGSYRMVLPNGEAFDAEIAPFSLAVPHAVN